MAKKTTRPQTIPYYKTTTLECPLLRKSNSILRVGQIVALGVENNSTIIIPCDGLAPFGVVVAQTEDINTIEYRRFIGETDMFVEREIFPFAVGANLYCTEGGRFSSHSLGYLPAVGIVMYPPTPTNPLLQFMWL